MYVKYQKYEPNYIISVSNSSIKSDSDTSVVKINYEFESIIDDFGFYKYKYIDNNVIKIDDLTLLKQKAIKNFKEKTEQDILYGFYSNAKYGEDKFYTYSFKDQHNMANIMVDILFNPDCEIHWKHNEMLYPEIWNKEDFKLLFKDSQVHKDLLRYRFYDFQNDITMATTIEEVNIIINNYN